MSETTESATPEEQKAREEAEARRQRILEKANDRMGLVEGTLKKNDDDDNDGDNNKTTSTSSKLAAMRRRRFKKSVPKPEEQTEPQQQKPEETTTTATTETTEKKTEKDTTATTTTAQTEPEPEPEKETKVDDEKETTKADVIDTKVEIDATPKVEESATTPKEEESTAATTAAAVTEDETTGGEKKKKYLGVAKMRRRMIKERQQKKEEEKEQQNDDNDNDIDDDDKKTTDAKKKIIIKQNKQKDTVKKLPLIMNAITVLLLFIAGLDVGLQQQYLLVQETESKSQQYIYHDKNPVTVHVEYAPRTLGGVQKVLSYTSSMTTTTTTVEEGSKDNNKATLLKSNNNEDTTIHTEDHDEFDIPEKVDNSGNNIDPLFGVDLDKLTEGSGLYMSMARFAVKAHRFNLKIFYYGPKSFFYTLVSIFITSPPILCLLAIIIRQIIGKTLLGAHLPAKVDDATQHKDVMSTIKQFISNFILRSFPTAVSLYDGWVHLRADMYVILCGFFIGMAISHSSNSNNNNTVQEQEEGLSDEL